MNIPGPIKQDAKLPIISPAHETPESGTASGPMKENAVTHIVAHE